MEIEGMFGPENLRIDGKIKRDFGVFGREIIIL